MPDTIVAISTPAGEGGIGIVRLSGPEAFAVTQRFFKPAHTHAGFPRSRYLYYGHIFDADGEEIDEVLVSFMKAPFTYTREDVVEINCHSGILTTRMILKIFLQAGMRLADPGEFTRRAFLNGRIDLSQAESILRIIRARSEQAVKIAAANLRGNLSNKITAMRDKITAHLATLEATLDFPEEVEPEPVEPIREGLRQLEAELSDLLSSAERGRILQEGIETVIAGKPNVGKSSLLNVLLRQQRAIVHEIPGTTRDLLEGYISLGGYPLRLIDTAGIRHTEDPVEKIGVERSREALSQARLVLLVLDASRPLSEDDEKIMHSIHEQHRLVAVLNKIDLGQAIQESEIKKLLPAAAVVKTSLIKNTGIKELEKTIVDILDQVQGGEGDELLLTSIRHQEIIREALAGVQRAKEILGRKPLELAATELRWAWEKLGEITGESVTEAVLDYIFSQFCVGK